MIRQPHRRFEDAAASVAEARNDPGEDPCSAWSRLQPVEIGAGTHGPARTGLAAQHALDMLRTRLVATMQEKNWTTLAVCAPTAKCGTTSMAVALATGLARQRDMRVALFDFNLRRPGIARALDLKGPFYVADLLNGGAAPEKCLVRHGDRLAIAPNSRAYGDPTEILHSASAGAALQLLLRQLSPDFAIFDLPPMLEHDDLLGFLPFVDCVLLVLGAERSSVGQADLCERELSARGKLLGVVLNRCRLGLDEFDI